MSEDNLKLWNEVEKTDPKFTKQYKGKGGFQGTAICSQWQIYKATELWGPIGKEWGPTSEDFQVVLEGKESVLLYSAILKHPEGSFPISSSIDFYSGKGYKDNDVVKKITTDALTKGLSKLGFSADVFMGKFDDNKYVNEMKKEFSDKGEKKGSDMTIELLVSNLPSCKTEESLSKYMKDNTKFVNSLFDKDKKEVIAEFSKRKIEITELGGSSQAQR